jgi:hypothetical protein
VSVEFALALPVLVVVLAMGLAGVRWALAAANSQTAAAQGARVAIVESDARAREVAGHVASAGQVGVTVEREGDWVTVCVPVPPVPPIPGGNRCATAYDEP